MTEMEKGGGECKSATANKGNEMMMKDECDKMKRAVSGNWGRKRGGLGGIKNKTKINRKKQGVGHQTS